MQEKVQMKNVLEWLERSAQRVPEHVAFEDPDGEITFGELAKNAQRIGERLLPYIGWREPVAFYMEKSVLAVQGMFGAVYAGGFYSFLDLRSPKARTDQILDVLQPKVVLTDEANLDAAREVLQGRCEITLLTVEELLRDEGAAGHESAGLLRTLAAVRARALDTDTLYVNFTSGSTGTPKGVAVAHRSVIDFISCFTEIFGIDETDILANQAPFDFDVSVKDIYSGLCTGAAVALIPRTYFSNPTLLMDYLCDRRVTTLIWAVSAMCFVSIMNGFGYRTPETIRRVMFSGEVMPVKQLKIWQKALPDVTYVNLYGPTEITCNCSYYILPKGEALPDVIPAGRAFPNEHVFLLDEDDHEIPMPDVREAIRTGEGSARETSDEQKNASLTEGGAEPGKEACERIGTDPGKEDPEKGNSGKFEESRVGEICVSGTCVALGYYRNPEKTAEAFVQNPLNDVTYERIYRTGDLGKWDANGNLVYVSRKDFQVKYLGQRIELGEIENAAMKLDGVTRACVLFDAARKKLVLFYTGEKEKKAVSEELRALLPQYMIPGKIIPLDTMPMTKNGKIDRSALKQTAGIA